MREINIIEINVMHVIVNCTKHIEIEDPDIIVKDKRLYNKRFDYYEGVDGDYVSFDVKLDNGSIMTIGGTVDGYTNGPYVKLRGRDIPYNAPKKIVQKISVVSPCEDKDQFKDEMDLALE